MSKTNFTKSQLPMVRSLKAIARRQALFNELEALELDIISGETVDLAPYAKRLMPS